MTALGRSVAARPAARAARGPGRAMPHPPGPWRTRRSGLGLLAWDSWC